MADSMDDASIVGTFVNTLEFKRKKIGGVDEMDALGKIEELAGLYEERIEKLNRELAQAKQEAKEERTRAEALSARLKAVENQPPAISPAPLTAAHAAGGSSFTPTSSAPGLAATDDFMRTLQEVRADVLAKARDEASTIVSRARETADKSARFDQERRTHVIEAARTARGQAEAAMRKLAEALGDVEALESGFSGAAGDNRSAKESFEGLRRSSLPDPLDPWQSPFSV